jgi:hypothetical protein
MKRLVLGVTREVHALSYLRMLVHSLTSEKHTQLNRDVDPFFGQ